MTLATVRRYIERRLAEERGHLLCIKHKTLANATGRRFLQWRRILRHLYGFAIVRETSKYICLDVRKLRSHFNSPTESPPS